MRLAELLYDASQKLGVVTDFLMKQQGMLHTGDSRSFEAMFALLVKRAEGQEDGVGDDDKARARARASRSEDGQGEVSTPH